MIEAKLVYVKRKKLLSVFEQMESAAMVFRAHPTMSLLVLVTLDCSSIPVVLLNNRTPLLLKFHRQGRNVLHTDNQTVSNKHVTEGSRLLLVKGQNVAKKTPVLIVTRLVTALVAITSFRGIPQHYMFM